MLTKLSDDGRRYKMKKYLSLLLAAVITSSSFTAFAEVSSGLKGLDISKSGTTATITGDGFSAVWNVKEYILGDEWNYEVILTSGSDVTEYFEIRSSCGEKVYETQDVVLAPGKTIKRHGTMTDLLQGMQKISVEVVRNDGTVVGRYVKSLPVMNETVHGYLSKYTRKVGMSGGSGGVDQYHMDWLHLLSSRRQHTWETIEKQEGIYSDIDYWMDNVNYANSVGGDFVFLLAYNNKIYSGATDNKKGPSTKKEFDGFGNYVKEFAKTYQNVEYYEIWNEPNGMWKPQERNDYTCLAEVAKLKAKSVNKDSKTLIGSVANGDYGFVDEVFAEGLWANMDIVANHPYIRPSKVDQSYHGVLTGMANAITKHGGWKEQFLTEIGWPTHAAGISEEGAAIEHAKQIIVADYYGITQNQIYMLSDVKSGGNSEQCFGTLYNSSGFKPSGYTVKQVIDKTGGGVFAGRLIFEDKPELEAYLYIRDGIVTCVAWAKVGEETLDFGREMYAEDMWGNPIERASSFTLKEEPIYIIGIDNEWLVKTLQKSSEQYLKMYIPDAFEESVEKKGWDKAMELMQKSADNAGSLSKLGHFPTEEEALAAFDKNYEIMHELIGLYESGELEIEIDQLDGLLYVNNWIAEMLNAVYIMTIDEKDSYVPSALNSVKTARETLKEKAGERTLSYATAIIDAAEVFAEDADGIYNLDGTNPMKAGAFKGWDVMADRLSKLAIRLSEVEEIGDDNVLCHLPSTEKVVALSSEDTIYASLYNFRDSQSVSGHAQIVSPSGEVVGKSDDVTVEAGVDIELPISIMIPEIKKGDYYLEFVENGEVIKRRKARLKGEIVYEAAFKNITKTFDDIDTVTINYKNYTEKDFTGKASIEPLCNWTIKGSTTQDITIPANGEAEFSWSVDTKERTSYNTYPFKITITNDEGKVLWEDIQMLNFTVIVKSDKKMSTVSFNGDISDFEDAYPVYVSLPEDPTNSDLWFDGGYYTRMLSKWDDNYLYLLFDVFDWYHENMQTGANIWNGDSIQIAFDALNDAMPDQIGYGANDFEFGFAFNEEKGNSVFAWYDSVTNKEEEKPSDWVSVVRNQELGITRYFAAIPKESLSPLPFASNTNFGMDVVYNNSNVGTRANFVGFAYAIASGGKQVGKHWDFFLVNENTTEEMKKIDNPIPTVLEGATNESVIEVAFIDIDNHWAKNDISALAKLGRVSGYGDGTFRPDNMVSKGEFMVMLINILKNKYLYVDHSRFIDVDIFSWYGDKVAKAEKYGYITKDLFDEYYLRPHEPITREEAFAVLGNWAKIEGKTWDTFKPLYTFSDCNDISLWAAEGFQTLYNLGIIDGYDDNELKPQNNITRAEAISILNRAMKK